MQHVIPLTYADVESAQEEAENVLQIADHDFKNFLLEQLDVTDLPSDELL